MDSDKLRVMVATSSYWLVGDTATKGLRIQDVLKDGSTDYLTMFDVQVYRHPIRECITNLSDLTLPKNKIEIVVVSLDQHEAPTKRWNNFTAKAAFETFAVVGNYCIQGKLQLSTAPSDSMQALTQYVESFFAITQATLSCPGMKQIHVPLLIANKKYVSCFHVGEFTDAKNSELERQSSTQPKETDVEENSMAQLLEELDGMRNEVDVSDPLSFDSAAR